MYLLRKLLALILAAGLTLSLPGVMVPRARAVQPVQSELTGESRSSAPAAQTAESRPEDVPEEITIYVMSSLYEEFLSIPRECPEFWSFDGYTIDILGDEEVPLSVQNQNTLIPRYQTWYYRYENGWWVGSSTPTGAPGEILVRECAAGDYEIKIDGAWTVTVHLVDYAVSHTRQIMDAWLDDRVTDDMTQYQIAELCCQYVAGFGYSPDHSSAAGMILSGGGDCWASSAALCYMLEREGIQCEIRDASGEPGAGERHMNVLALLDDEYYILEAGYNLPAPRPYQITKYLHDSLFFYQTVKENGVETAHILGRAFEQLATELVIPEQVDGIPVTGIAANAFHSNHTITSVVLPDTIRYLGADAFKFCFALERINLPEGLEVLEDGCFTGCESLRELHLPSTLSRIGPFCVNECYSLSAIHVHEDNPWYASIDGILTNKEKNTLLIFPNGKGDWRYAGPRVDGRAPIKSISTLEVSCEIPEGITTIAQGAFLDVFLGRLVLPDSITEIQSNAFVSSYLRELTLPEGLTSIDEGTFYEGGIYELTLPSTLKRIEKAAFYRTLIYGELILPDGVEFIGEGAFYGAVSLHASIPASIREISAYAFDLWAGSASTTDASLTGAIFFDRDCQPDGIDKDAFGEAVLCVYPGSPMHSYALENDLPWYPRGEDGTIEIQQEWFKRVDWDANDPNLSGSYTGSPVIPKLRWDYAEGKCPFAIRELHLELICSDPINIGTCALTINGKGLLSGTVTTEYEITPAGSDADVIDRSGCGLQYRIAGDHVEIVKYIAAAISETLVIPDTIEGLPVTGIMFNALSDCSTIRKVIIPESVGCVESGSFKNCENLEGVWFTGDRPIIYRNAFEEAIVYYPADNETWAGSLPGNTGIAQWIPMCAEPGMHHDLTESVRVPDCTQEGTIAHTCQTCGYSYSETVPATGHNYEAVVTEPSCEAGGYTTHTCDKCGDSYTSDETAALGHVYEEGTCSRCGEEAPDPVPENPFTDIPESQWYFEPVLWAVEEGITSGTSATTFSPDQTCTRAQVVTFLWRAFGKPEPTRTDNPFTDVAEGDYFYNAVLWAVENGITAGMNATTFGPSNPCTRGQVVTFLWRAMDEPLPENAGNPFADVTEGEWFFNPVLWAVENGITAGMSPTTFAPGNPCTRAHVVTFLWRTMEGDMP